MNGIAAVILCGGESRRMGRSKAWLPFGDETLLQRVVRILDKVASPLLVVAAPGQDLPSLPTSVGVLRDPVEHQGPLQGLATGLAALGNSVDLVYVSATDGPFLRSEWVNRLADLIGAHDVAMPRVGGYDQPLAALYRRAAVLPAVLALIEAGRMRPTFLVDAVKTRIVTEDELKEIDPTLDTLRNLNTPEDYEQALRKAGFD